MYVYTYIYQLLSDLIIDNVIILGGIVLSYYILDSPTRDKSFAGFILNSPFIDWSFSSNLLAEMAMETFVTMKMVYNTFNYIDL